MPLILTVIQGAATGHQVVVTAERSPRTVGRSAVADVYVPDEWLSDVHFAVYYDGARAVLRDLQSANGTYVNSTGITECALNHGDQVAAGQTFFSVDMQPDVAAPPVDDGELTPDDLLTAFRNEPRDRVRWALRDEAHTLYAVIDVAHTPDLLVKINRSGEEFCAFDETRDPEDPGDTAPMLVALSSGGELLVDVVDETWSTGVAVFLTSEHPFHEVFAHLVGQVEYADDGSVRATSFHKPDVLYEQLARCSTDEAAEFFGPVAAFLAESENPDELLRFQRSESGVEVQSIPVGL